MTMTPWKTDSAGLCVRTTTRGAEIAKVTTTLSDKRVLRFLRQELSESGLTPSEVVRVLLTEAVTARIDEHQES